MQRIGRKKYLYMYNPIPQYLRLLIIASADHTDRSIVIILSKLLS